MHWISGQVIAGYGVASGTGRDQRYRAGTLSLQQPFFLEHGIDLSPYFSGTINVDVTPNKPIPEEPLFDGVLKWFCDIEERFLLSQAVIEVGGRQYAGLWYYPHPETKPGHYHHDTVVELVLPWIDGLKTGKRVLVKL